MSPFSLKPPRSCAEFVLQRPKFRLAGHVFPQFSVSLSTAFRHRAFRRKRPISPWDVLDHAEPDEQRDCERKRDGPGVEREIELWALASGVAVGSLVASIGVIELILLSRIFPFICGGDADVHSSRSDSHVRGTVFGLIVLPRDRVSRPIRRIVGAVSFGAVSSWPSVVHCSRCSGVLARKRLLPACRPASPASSNLAERGEIAAGHVDDEREVFAARLRQSIGASFSFS